ncbi:hypothetical protein HD806DRAFT_546694 [Xylariaceae sp. AK1471]|nr:hypothetical protein HD806DRAFT_546694 [Xylariaceae sp. AK1471]
MSEIPESSRTGVSKPPQPPQLYAWAVILEDEDEAELSPLRFPRFICIAEKEPKSPVLIRTLVTASCAVEIDQKLCIIAADLPLAVPRTVPGRKEIHNEGFENPDYYDRVPFKACLKVGRVVLPQKDELQNKIILIDPDTAFSPVADYAGSVPSSFEIDSDCSKKIEETISAARTACWLGEKHPSREKFVVNSIISLCGRHECDGMKPYMKWKIEPRAVQPYEPLKLHFLEHEYQSVSVKLPAKTRYTGVLVLNKDGKAIGITYSMDPETEDRPELWYHPEGWDEKDKWSDYARSAFSHNVEAMCQMEKASLSPRSFVVGILLFSDNFDTVSVKRSFGTVVAEELGTFVINEDKKQGKKGDEEGKAVWITRVWVALKRTEQRD